MHTSIYVLYMYAVTYGMYVCILSSPSPPSNRCGNRSFSNPDHVPFNDGAYLDDETKHRKAGRKSKTKNR